MLPTDEKSLATACDTDVIDDEFSGACNVVLVPTLDSRESRDPMSLTPGQSLLPAWHFPTCHRQSSLRRERAKNDGLCLQSIIQTFNRLLVACTKMSLKMSKKL